MINNSLDADQSVGWWDPSFKARPKECSLTFLFQQLLLCQHDNLLHHFWLQDVLYL